MPTLPAPVCRLWPCSVSLVGHVRAPLPDCEVGDASIHWDFWTGFAPVSVLFHQTSREHLGSGGPPDRNLLCVMVGPTLVPVASPSQISRMCWAPLVASPSVPCPVSSWFRVQCLLHSSTGVAGGRPERPPVPGLLCYRSVLASLQPLFLLSAPLAGHPFGGRAVRSWVCEPGSPVAGLGGGGVPGAACILAPSAGVS